MILIPCKQGKASEFEEERNNGMRWAPGKPAPAWEFLEEVYKSVIRSEAHSSEEAEEEIEVTPGSYLATSQKSNPCRKI